MQIIMPGPGVQVDRRHLIALNIAHCCSSEIAVGGSLIDA
jgi:hypothetical protein